MAIPQYEIWVVKALIILWLVGAVFGIVQLYRERGEFMDYIFAFVIWLIFPPCITAILVGLAWGIWFLFQ